MAWRKAKNGNKCNCCSSSSSSSSSSGSVSLDPSFSSSSSGSKSYSSSLSSSSSSEEGVCCFEYANEQDDEYHFDSISGAVSFAEGQGLGYVVYKPGEAANATGPDDVVVATLLWNGGTDCRESTKEDCPEGVIVEMGGPDDPYYQAAGNRGLRWFDPEEYPDLSCDDNPCSPCPCPREDLVAGQFVIDIPRGLVIFRGCTGCENAPADGEVLPLPGSSGNVNDLVEEWVGVGYFAYCSEPVQDIGGGVRIYNFTVSEPPPCNGNLKKKGEVKEVETRALPAGPGTELKKLLKMFGLPDRPGCKCNKRAQLMDKWGVDECSKPEKITEIVGWLREEAEKRRLPFVEWGARVIVKRAIRNARKAK